MQKVRLPSYIKPERYKLLVKPDLESFTFEGEEMVTLVLDKSVSSITLHAKELKVFDVSYRSKKYEVRSKAVKYDPKSETVIFTFSSKLPKGRGELSLKFKGILNDKMRGFYRSRYTHKNTLPRPNLRQRTPEGLSLALTSRRKKRFLT